MTNTSSRILREAEHAVVTPIAWRATTSPVLPKGNANSAATQEIPAERYAAAEREHQLQQDRENNEQEAYQRGFSEGKSVGQQQAKAELQPVLDQLGKSLAALSSLRSRIRAEAEGDLLKLAISIARRVLHRELTLEPESIEGVIRVALEKLQSRELCRIRVHPDQESAIRSALERFSNSQKVELVADSSMQCGDVIFETAHGNLDASIESQLREIERGFADRLRRLSCGPVTMDSSEKIALAPYMVDLDRMDLLPWSGQVTATVGLLIESQGPAAAIGDFCEIQAGNGRSIRTQVIGFRNGRVLAMPLDEPDGLQLGSRVIARSQDAQLAVGPGLLGRVLDGFGQPMDGGPPIESSSTYPLYAPPPNPLQRKHITDRLVTGVRSIDSLLACGKGQRIGLFGGSGVGKSTLLGAMSRKNSAQVSVIALIGERNREVKAFIENELGAEGMKRSVVVVATSDRPAPLRIRAAYVALAAAEYFRDQGADVLLVMDSVTRLAMAQREIGLAAGEPPSQKGYTPSVFALLPKIFERAGNFGTGSITGFFTVLVEGDDFNEPICDAARGILDGHFILSRDLASSGHYPAIDILNSVSRLSNKVITEDELAANRRIREALSTYHQSADLIQLGAHVQGANPILDRSIRVRPQILDFLRQDSEAYAPLDETRSRLFTLAKELS